MSLADSLIQEFEHESAVTRRLLARLPDDLSWRPHEKSMTLGQLAGHIAEIPQWGTVVMDRAGFEISSGEFRALSGSSRSEILEAFETHLNGFNKGLQGKSDESFLSPWKLSKDGHAIFELPRIAVLRSFVLSHLIHHRGQLSVYLRLKDVPVPPIYGRSADES